MIAEVSRVKLPLTEFIGPYQWYFNIVSGDGLVSSGENNYTID